MTEKLKALFHKYYDLIMYVIFGAMTTAVNYLVYLPCYNLLGLDASVSNVISWVVSVAFAFLTNKPFVFRSRDWSPGVVWPELLKFVGCRVGSGALETAILFIAVDTLHWDGNLWKLVTSILVVAANYVGSKLLVFRKK